jgi:hypothetical protein
MFAWTLVHAMTHRVVTTADAVRVFQTAFWMSRAQ